MLETKIAESRLIHIQDKIISIKDLKKLADFVFKEFKHIKKSDDYANIRFSATCDDKSIFSSEHPSIFDENSRLSTKHVISATITLDSYKPDVKRISIRIEHSSDNLFLRSLFDNRIEVEGKNSNWVNGTLKNLEEMIDSFTPQNTFVRRHKVLLSILFALSIGTVISKILLLLVSNVPPSPEPPTGLAYLLIQFLEKYPYPIFSYVIIYIFNLIWGIVPAIYLVSKLQALYPSVELQIGPEHKYIEKTRRQWIINSFLAGILPLILSLLYDIIKNISQ